MSHPACRPPGTDRAGLALVGAVAALLLLGLVAHGALMLARFEAATAEAGEAWVRARAGVALARAATTGRTLPGPELDSAGLWQLLPWNSGTLPGVAWRTDVRRASREGWWLEHTAWDERSGVRIQEGALVWRLDPVARVASFRAVVEVAHAATGTDKIDGTDVLGSVAPLASADCRPWNAALDSVMGPGLPSAGGLAVGQAVLGLGPAVLADFDSWLEPSTGGTVTPAPSTSHGRCDTTDPWNWGDPRGGGRPCGDRFVTRLVRGDLDVAGGEGQGLLVVTGDLHLRAGAAFLGVVLVGGTFRLEEATFSGLARVGSFDAGPASRVRGSACHAVRALAYGAAGRPTLQVPGGSRIGPW